LQDRECCVPDAGGRSSSARTHSFFHDLSRQTALAKTDNNDYHLRQRAMSPPASTTQGIVWPH
jgi:hypothetical protein